MDKIKEINYKAKPMDVLLFGSNNLLGRAIRYAQACHTVDKKPSLFSHCALWVNEETIIESTIDFEKYETGSRLDNGIQYNPISRILKYNHTLLVQYPLTELERELLCRRADRLYQQKITYPILGLMGSLLSYWIFGCASNPLQSKHSLYCSAFVQEVYDTVKYDFSRRHTARNTSPEMIYQFEIDGMKRWWV